MLAIELFETKLNPKNPIGDYYAKTKALHELEQDNSVDQKIIQQRKKDLQQELKNLSEGFGKKTLLAALVGLLMVGNVTADEAVKDAVSIARKAYAMKDYNLEALEGEAKQELFNILRTIEGHPNQSKLWPLIKDVITTPEEEKLPPLQDVN